MSTTAKQEAITQLKTNMKKVIIGKDREIELLLVALLANGHVLLEDVPGTGKTMLAKTLAKSVGGQFQRIQFTPDVLPSDVTGIHFFNPKEQQFELRLGPVHANIVLADEINRATPRTQSSLLEAMEEGQTTIDGQSIALPVPFFVIATQNPVESQGTFPLPEAQMDRFLLRLRIGYPSQQEEHEMMQRFKKDQPLHDVQALLPLEDIIQIQEAVKGIHIHEEVEKYMVDIVHATRSHASIEVGVSPRGTLSFMRAAQAYAFIKQRTFVTPDDCKAIAPYVLAHRLILTLDAQLHGTEYDVLRQILEQVSVPLEEVGER